MTLSSKHLLTRFTLRCIKTQTQGFTSNSSVSFHVSHNN